MRAALISSNILSLETQEEASSEKPHRQPKVTQLGTSEQECGSRLQEPACCPCLGARGSQDATGHSFPLLSRGPGASREQMQARVSSRPAACLCVSGGPWRRGQLCSPAWPAVSAACGRRASGQRLCPRPSLFLSLCTHLA